MSKKYTHITLSLDEERESDRRMAKDEGFKYIEVWDMGINQVKKMINKGGGNGKG